MKEITIMKITKPEEMMSTVSSQIEEAIIRFEIEFAKEDKDEDYYHLVIVREYNRRICDTIEELYSKAGWNNVICKTSSENGERPGLTGLQLWRIGKSF